MRCAIFTTLFAAGLANLTSSVHADHWGQSYPRVRTFSGGYYGPTQAHYQYQRRYGRPWHGQGGFYGGAGVGAVNGYSANFGSLVGGWGFPSYSYYGCNTFLGSSAFFNGYGAYGFGTYAPIWGGGVGLPSPWSYYTSPPVPYVPGFGLTTAPTAPGVISPQGPMNPVLSDAWDENLKQWEQPLELQPVIPAGKPALPASTPAAKIRSVQLQDHGDRRLLDSDFRQASLRYRDAISAAPDRAEPHLHLAIALAGMKQFDEAVKELKVGLTLDPSWAASGVSLDVLLGPDNFITKTQLKQRIAEWTLQDVRDADRLFLLGAMLYLDNDADKGRQILETAARLTGMHEHLAVFLKQRGSGPELAVGTADPQLVEEPIEQTGDSDEPELPGLPPLPIEPQDDDIPPPPPSTQRPESKPQQLETAIPSPQLDGPILPN